MLIGISPESLLNMKEQERRWFNNVKKAFHDSDRLYSEGRPQECMEPMCKAVDAAKTLRRSLLGQDFSSKQNAQRFKEFLNLEIPSRDRGGLLIPLVDARTGAPQEYSFSDLVYCIRCMIHENENLNASETPDYHVLLDWEHPRASVFGTVEAGRITCNGHLVWGRLREIVSKFITGIDAMMAVAKGDPFSITIRPPIGSIKPTT